MNLMTLIKERMTTDQQQALEAEIRASDPLTPAQRAHLVKDRERINSQAAKDLASHRARQRAAQEKVDELFREREVAIAEGREVDRQVSRAASGWARERAPIEHALRKSAAAVVSAFRGELLNLYDRERSLVRRGGFVDAIEYDVSETGRKIPQAASVAAADEQRTSVAGYLGAIVEELRGLDDLALSAADPERAVNEARKRLAAMRRETRLEPWRGR
jgi:hypothetical protein